MSKKERVAKGAVILAALIAIAGYATAKEWWQEEQEGVSIKYGKAQIVDIAADKVNRLSFAPLVVKSLWGEGSKYKAVLSDSGRELFISPQVAVGESVELAAELADCRIIDLILTSKAAATRQIVHIGLNGAIESRLAAERIEAAAMIKAMRQGVMGKYYVLADREEVAVELSRIISGYEEKEIGKRQKWAKINAVQEEVYRFGNLQGVVLVLRNIGSIAVKIEAEKLGSMFENCIAVSIEQDSLAKGQTSRAYLVLKRKVD